MSSTGNGAGRRTRTRLLALIAGGLLLAAGCAMPQARRASTEVSGKEAAGGPSTAAPGRAHSGPATVQNVALLPRKIIYTAEVELVAESLSVVARDLAELVKARGGYVAETDIGGETESPRQGRWKVRVPVEQFEAFMAGVTRLGEVRTTRTDSQDVSEEFYDLDARIKNKKIEEARLLEHLQRTTAKLQDILAVERELSRVRGEIERMEGRLRVLANLSDLTTVTITIQEIKDYVAPKPPTFATQIGRTLAESLGQLRDFGKALVLIAIALLPWLVVAALVAFPVRLLVRRVRSARATKARPV
uniref:DUF4349 domain-containing protein n=1 Tax=uncultured Armatimonadetes bacterium TaxID=157466 RepID=A0A6J4IQB0_9BACT|nr:hypothetical protein AVDCRST_MAG63-2185 [uncultured Armatimonadetes bacterium]